MSPLAFWAGLFVFFLAAFCYTLFFDTIAGAILSLVAAFCMGFSFRLMISHMNREYDEKTK